MKIYIDSEFKCHTTNPEGVFREFKISFFDNKCDEFISGYRYIPLGENWTRDDGVSFCGEMAAPWKSYEELDIVQRDYERKLLIEYEAAIAELDAALLDAQYNNLVEGL